MQIIFMTKYQMTIQRMVSNQNEQHSKNLNEF